MPPKSSGCSSRGEKPTLLQCVSEMRSFGKMFPGSPRVLLMSETSNGFRVFCFQAEDGIRVKLVTGVQTCALPILRLPVSERSRRCPGRMRCADCYPVSLRRAADDCGCRQPDTGTSAPFFAQYDQ